MGPPKSLLSEPGAASRNMVFQRPTLLLLLVSLPQLVIGGVPHSHGVKKGHGEREEDGAYRYLAVHSVCFTKYSVIFASWPGFFLEFRSVSGLYPIFYYFCLPY